MMAVFPPPFHEQELRTALVPFRLQASMTPTLAHELAPTDGRLYGASTWTSSRDDVQNAQRLRHRAGSLLRHQLDLEYSLIMAIPNSDTAGYHFEVVFDSTFLTVDAVGELPPLPAEARARLLASLSDCRTLMQLLPPERFLFGGFTVFRAVDVTDQEILSSLKRELIERESIVSTTSLSGSRTSSARSSAGRDSGWAWLPSKASRCSCSATTPTSRRGASSPTPPTTSCRTYRLHLRACCEERDPLIIEDLQNHRPRGPIEDHLLANGVRSIVVAPLHYQDQLIGTLELTSETPGDFNATHSFKLREVLPLFSIAVKRSTDELDTRVQALIKEQFTAIHPSVEWRFRRPCWRPSSTTGAVTGGAST